MVTRWPEYSDDLLAPTAADEVQWVIDLITETRSVRADLNIPAGAKVPMTVIQGSAEDEARVATYERLIERLARVEPITLTDRVPEGAVQFIQGDTTIALTLAGAIDLEAEKARLEKEIAKLNGDIAKTDKKLANEQFLSKAPEHVIAEQKDRRDEAEKTKNKLADALKTLSELSA